RARAWSRQRPGRAGAKGKAPTPPPPGRPGRPSRLASPRLASPRLASAHLSHLRIARGEAAVVTRPAADRLPPPAQPWHAHWTWRPALRARRVPDSHTHG